MDARAIPLSTRLATHAPPAVISYIDQLLKKTLLTIGYFDGLFSLDGRRSLSGISETASHGTRNQWLVLVRLLACLYSCFQRSAVPPRPDRCAKPECGGLGS